MRMPSTTALLLNGGVALIAVASVATMGRSMLVREEIETCRARYSNAVQWSLLRDDGQLLSTSDLQARLGASDWGLMDRVTVVKADHAAGSALAVDLAGRSSTVAASPAQSTGAGFEWSPQSAGPVPAACATYSFKLDRDFDFAAGGRLPGLIGGPAGSDRNTPEAFSVRVAWNEDGLLDLHTQFPGASTSRALRNERDAIEVPRGRWVTVDQEVVLNTPGRDDGIVRVWVDGRLRFESHKAAFRTDTAGAVRGVLAEVAYARPSTSRDSASSVLVTPFEYRW